MAFVILFCFGTIWYMVKCIYKNSERLRRLIAWNTEIEEVSICIYIKMIQKKAILHLHGTFVTQTKNIIFYNPNFNLLIIQGRV